ncbi:MAG TPA: alpha-1,2-fucosyltransferase [Xanthobacteraceae bacterium]
MSEEEADIYAAALSPKQDVDVVIAYKGLKDYFAKLLPHHAFLKNEIWRITKPNFQKRALSPGRRFIALHVRRGDQILPHQSEHEVAKHPQCTPLNWFVVTIRKIRAVPSCDDIPIIVFTDGTPAQIAPLMQEKNVFMAPSDVAIVDLLKMSRSSMLLASGYSTFSMWASFLGGMPTVYAPGKIQQYVQSGRPRSIEIELGENEKLPKEALRCCLAAVEISE